MFPCVGTFHSACSRELRNEEKLVMLLHDLKSKPQAAPHYQALSNQMFPRAFALKECYRFLEFETEDKVSELERLISVCNVGLLSTHYQQVKNEVWKSHYQTKIEKLHLEKVSISSNISNLAGMNMVNT